MEELSLSDGKLPLYSAKSDLKSAFRILPLSVSEYMLLIMYAVSPLDNKVYYFVDKCLPFGASISCALFQQFSNCLAHIQKIKSGRSLVNYLDDFYFVAFLRTLCNQQVYMFIELCNQIGFPVSIEKTEWASTILVFLGLLIDTEKLVIAIPLEKVQRAAELIWEFLNAKKATVKRIQQLCGYLNFLCRSILPGRAFTRRIYALTESKSTGKPLLSHHHVNINSEAKMDLTTWETFLKHQSVFCRPFIHCTHKWQAIRVKFYTDSTANPDLGMGGWCEQNWFFQRWDSRFVKNKNPSIEYLELYAVMVGVLLWIHKFSNKNIIIFCDNESVKFMINASSSTCKNCMVLMRIIVLQCLIHNAKLQCEHVSSKDNFIADSLSRMEFEEFWTETKRLHLPMSHQPEEIPDMVWPMQKLWID